MCLYVCVCVCWCVCVRIGRRSSRHVEVYIYLFLLFFFLTFENVRQALFKPLPHGQVFGCFMACSMMGSSLVSRSSKELVVKYSIIVVKY
jgi:hypothetical protein